MSAERKPEAGLRPIYQVIGYLDKHAPFPIGSLLLGVLIIAYLTNPTAGVIELLPDNMPFVGNLDEATAAFLLVWAGANLFRWARVRRAQRQGRENGRDKEEQ